MTRLGLLCLVVLAFGPPLRADDLPYTRNTDVIHHRKYGSALTMDVFTPKENAKGVGVVFAVSGGWFSAHEAIDGIAKNLAADLLKRGYTVFAVVHGSQPKYTTPEILEDMHRAVRYVRAHAKDYGIDPDRLGITGASAGGHPPLLQR